MVNPPDECLRDRWALAPGVAYLNHGSFGACPKAVLDAQQALRAEMEAQAVDFLWRRLEGRLDTARAILADFVDARPDDMAWVRNATLGVNTVLQGLDLAPGDELVTTDHEYNACANALRFVADRAGARVVVAAVPFPSAGPEEVVAAVLGAVTARTRLVLLDHVTSPTALVQPVAAIAAACRDRGVAVLVDGAHAPGMIPLSLASLGDCGVTYYTGNLHKWVCAPKGAGFVWANPEARVSLRPLVVSHGANSVRRDRSRFRLEFDWTGTDDPTPWLCVPEALRVMGSMLPGGWDALRAANRTLCLQARDGLCKALGVLPPAPDTMIGSMAAVALPPDCAAGLDADAVNLRLWESWRIEVPVSPWPVEGSRLLRVSAQRYNTVDEYTRLAEALRAL